MSHGKIVILGSLGESTRIIYHDLAQHFRIERVVVEDGVPRIDLLRRRINRLGLMRSLSQALFSAMVVPALRASSRRRLNEIRSALPGAESELPAHVVRHVPSVNSEECIELLGSIDPAVIVVAGTRIISERTLNSTSGTFINMHAGITPRYRGVHGAYWALAEARPEFAGVTIHIVDKGIDTGSILKQERIQPSPADTFVTYPLLQIAAGLPLLRQTISDALQGRLEIAPSLDEQPSALWYHPTVGEYFYHRLTKGVR